MTTEAETIAELARAGESIKEPVLIHDDAGRSWIFAPKDLERVEVTDPNRAIAPPAHIRQGVTVQAVDSLIAYVETHKTTNTTLFADIANNRIVAQIDYHAASDKAVSGAAGHLLHRATMTLPYSEEWKTWLGASGKMVGQLEFARFLEENDKDIATPTGADLLEVIHDLHAVRKVNFSKSVRTKSGNENFEYSDITETKTKGGLEIPSKFAISIPVYFDGEPVELTAFLRSKVDDGALTLGIAIHRAEHVRQAEFKRIVGDVALQTDRLAVFGSLG